MAHPSLKMLVSSGNPFVLLLVLVLLGAAATVAADAGRPIELLHVYGCPGSPFPRRTTAACPTTGKATITLRGRQFEFDSEVTLAQSKTLRPPPAATSSTAAARAAPPPLLQGLKCALKHHSKHLPHSLIFCLLPDLLALPAASAASAATYAPAEVRAALAAYGPAFDVHLTNIVTGQAAVLRRAVTFAALPPDPAAGPASGGDGDGGAPADNTIDGVAEKVFSSLESNVWVTLGVGGLKKQFSELFRRAFASRLGGLGDMVVNAGLPHVKGVILHGPPGTGKTLIARTIAQLLHAADVHVVNGPEIINKFVGESEKNLRGLFEAAEQDYKKNKDAAGLHVLIFDEIDVLLRHRGKGGDEKGIYDGVTTQMLALMDGVHSCPNMLIVGLTNRLDALDKALLRPGRFEVQIRIPLPDDDGRLQIFGIHTKSLRAHRYLSPAVDFHALARDTSSFSGADIAGVVRSATSFALERVVALRSQQRAEEAPASSSPEASATTPDTLPPTPCTAEQQQQAGSPLGSPTCCSPAGDGSSSSSSKPTGVDEGSSSSSAATSLFLVQYDDFVRGIREVVETKGSAANVSPFLARGGVAQLSGDRGPALRRILRLVQDLNTPAATSSLRRMRVLLHGPPGSGTTTLAALAARASRFSFVNILTADALAGLSIDEKLKQIDEAFSTASHVPQSFIVLDGLDTIVDATFGRPANDRILTEVLSCLHRDPMLSPTSVANSKIFVLITTSSAEVANQLHHLVDAVVKISGHVPVLDVVQQYGFFGEPDRVRDAKIAAAVAPTVSLKRLMFLAEVAAARAGLSSPGTAETASVPFRPITSEEDVSTSPAAAATAAAAPRRPPIPTQVFVQVLQEFGAFRPSRGAAAAPLGQQRLEEDYRAVDDGETIGGHSPV